MACQLLNNLHHQGKRIRRAYDLELKYNHKERYIINTCTIMYCYKLLCFPIALKTSLIPRLKSFFVSDKLQPSSFQDCILTSIFLFVFFFIFGKTRLFQKNTITFKQYAKTKVQVSFRMSVTNFLEKNMFNLKKLITHLTVRFN